MLLARFWTTKINSSTIAGFPDSCCNWGLPVFGGLRKLQTGKNVRGTPVDDLCDRVEICCTSPVAEESARTGSQEDLPNRLQVHADAFPARGIPGRSRLPPGPVSHGRTPFLRFFLRGILRAFAADRVAH